MAKKIMNEENEEFPGNSKASRVAPIRESKRIREEGVLVEEPKRIKKSIVGHAMRKKKTFTQSIAQTFVGENTQNVGSYILYEVLIPAFKSLVQDSVTSGIEMLLFGEASGRSKSRDRDKGRSTVSYGSFYKKDRDRDDRYEHRRPVVKDKFELDEIFFKDHMDAEEVLDELCERLEDYEEVSVAEFFELAGIDGATWAHDKYGWKDLRRARLTHTRHGYAILFPDPTELD